MSFNDYFYYSDGHIYWKKKTALRGGGKIGKRVGTFSSARGYVTMKFKNKAYRIQRVIWTMFKGPIPSGYLVDHIDCNKINNKIENLRLASKSQNACNSLKHRGKCEYKGVVKNRYGKFEVYIGIHGVRLNMGTYETQKEAAIAYDFAALFLHGEFARTNFKHGAVE